MTADEMMAFAKNVASGGEFTKKEAVAFCKALTSEASAPVESPSVANPAHAIANHGEILFDQPAKYGVVTADSTAAPPISSPFVRVTAQGAVHVQVAQFFTKREAKTLANAISYAAEY